MHALIKLELQQVEIDCSPSMEKHSRLDVSMSKMTNEKKGNKTVIKNGGEETNDIDDSVEKYLVPRDEYQHFGKNIDNMIIFV